MSEESDRQELSLELELVGLIEAYHTKYGEYPERSVFRYILDNSNFDVDNAQLDELLESETLKRSCAARGINHPSVDKDSLTGLTREQLAVAAALSNSRDNRSDAKKLSDLGIPTRVFSGWLHSNRFSEHMRNSTEQILKNSIADGHTALIRSVRKGDTNALKLFYELTGRYNPGFENQVNIQQFMLHVIEAIQKHVHDPATLQALAAELQMIAVANNVNPNEEIDKVDKSSVKSLAPKRKAISF
jgi:hypothetical protein